MARRRFRWTRKAYQHAAWLARFTGRHLYQLSEHPPALLRRYWNLWVRHPQGDDPLLTPLARRYEEQRGDDWIPF